MLQSFSALFIFCHLTRLFVRTYIVPYCLSHCVLLPRLELCTFQVGAPQFANGTTNGAAWYPLTGGMQDYNYIWHGCMEITLELSCCKYPPAAELSKFWEDNRASLLQLIGEAHRGVKGFVKDERANPIEGASMKVSIKIIFINLSG